MSADLTSLNSEWLWQPGGLSVIFLPTPFISTSRLEAASNFTDDPKEAFRCQRALWKNGRLSDSLGGRLNGGEPCFCFKSLAPWRESFTRKTESFR